MVVGAGRWLRMLRLSSSWVGEEEAGGSSIAGAAPAEAGLGPARSVERARGGGAGRGLSRLAAESRSQVLDLRSVLAAERMGGEGGEGGEGGGGGGGGGGGEGGEGARARGAEGGLHAARTAAAAPAPPDMSRVLRYLADGPRAARAGEEAAAAGGGASARARGGRPEEEEEPEEGEDPFEGILSGVNSESEEEAEAGDEVGALPGGGGRGGGRAAGGGRSISFVEAIVPERRQSQWTRTFLATQNDRGPAFAPFQMPRYHKKRLLAKLLAQLAAGGDSVLRLRDGTSVDLAQLALSDAEAAEDVAAAMASSLTAASSAARGKLTYAAASAASPAAAARSAARGAAGGGEAGRARGLSHAGVMGTRGGLPGLPPRGDAGMRGGGGGGGGAPGLRGPPAAPVAALLAVLPHESIKPRANLFNLLARVLSPARAWWALVMGVAELPVSAARALTIPLLHEGSYRRRMLLLNIPFCLAFSCEIVSTAVLKEAPPAPGGVPLFLLCFLGGLPLALLMNALLPSAHPGFCAALLSSDASEYTLPANEASQLLRAAAVPPGGARAAGAAASPTKGGVHGGAQGHSHGSHGHGHGPLRKWWVVRTGRYLAGPNTEPKPPRLLFTCYLIVSFLMSLFWLLLVANEIVGTAICMGKVFRVPDVVMGLTVLAIG